ncbi:MAG TPA: NAD-dependent epimerase/dehydratase family protein [Roseiflexaceae bacterium]
MKALVTGANGLIGANLVRELCAAGYEVRAFVRRTSDVRGLAGLAAEIVYGDVLQPETIAAAGEGCDLLFHTAAIFAYWGHTPDELATIAIEGARHAVEAAHRAGVRRVILTSSSVVLGSSARPILRDESAEAREQERPPYDSAKAAQERAAFRRAAELGVELVAVCPTISVGWPDYHLSPSNAVIVTYLNDPLRLTYPGGCNIVSARDVARGHILAAEAGVPGERYVLGSENLEWSTIHRTISELCGVPGPLLYTNHTGAYLAATAEELIAGWMRKRPATTRTQAKMVGRYYWYRHDRAAALGFAPRPARRALAEAIAWLVASPHVSRQLRATLALSREVYEARRAIERQAA